MTVILHPLYMPDFAPCDFSVSSIEDKLKGRHFGTTKVIEAKSQAMLNTLKEHSFHEAFRKCTSAGNGAHVWKGITSRVMAVSMPKVSLCPDGNNSPGNYGSEWYCLVVQFI
jgi:hypothetical protein